MAITKLRLKSVTADGELVRVEIEIYPSMEVKVFKFDPQAEFNQTKVTAMMNALLTRLRAQETMLSNAAALVGLEVS